MHDKAVLITGAAQRLGARIARTVHAEGANVIVHYRGSADSAHELCEELNQQRKESARAVQADLNVMDDIARLAQQATLCFGRIDVLVNNASSFYPTPIGEATLEQWDDLMGSNLRAPFFLSQALTPELTRRSGCILNLVDIHASRPLRNHPIYCAAKAGLVMLTQSLAKELGPDVRVNGVAPGPVMWPENGMSKEAKSEIIESTLLQRAGSAQDVATAALFLIRDATYTTGQIITVDGGRNLRS